MAADDGDIDDDDDDDDCGCGDSNAETTVPVAVLVVVVVAVVEVAAVFVVVGALVAVDSALPLSAPFVPPSPAGFAPLSEDRQKQKQKRPPVRFVYALKMKMQNALGHARGIRLVSRARYLRIPLLAKNGVSRPLFIRRPPPPPLYPPPPQRRPLLLCS